MTEVWYLSQITKSHNKKKDVEDSRIGDII